jgi:hypothetical protein
MKGKGKNKKDGGQSLKILIFLLIGYTFWIYYFSNPKPQFYYDYTFRVAENFLRGAIAFHEKPPSWVNEFVPFENNWYSAFPLGSVLTMLPFAFFKLIGLIKEMPASVIAALTASAICGFLLLIAKQYELEWKKRILMVCGFLFGTWMWTNLAMAGAWQLALGFAVLGELGAIYFTVYDRRPLLAGLFFALAFGNRTEILLTAPFFMYLLFKSQVSSLKSQVSSLKSQVSSLKSQVSSLKSQVSSPKSQVSSSKSQVESDNGKQKEMLPKDSDTNESANKPGTWDLRPGTKAPQLATLAKFCAFPFVLGVLTLGYNYVRFHSFTDFGYARIPGVLNEPWYAQGIFSIWYIPLNVREMLWAPWKTLANFPFLVPNGFGSAIWWSSPFIFLLFRFGARDKILKYTSWTAIAVLTFLLWTHGNPGGWQFGYRYAMILLPWMFVILLENSPKNVRWYELLLYIFSILINAYASYLFFWTDYIKP